MPRKSWAEADAFFACYLTNMENRQQALHEGRIRPTTADLHAARNRTLPDLIGPGMKVLFCGINPGLYTAAVGHHFAHPGNRFWPALHQAGFTERLYSPFEENRLLAMGYGLTNLAVRPTSGAVELTRGELEAGAIRLCRKLRRYRPGVLAVLGVGAFRTAFRRSHAKIGEQSEPVCETRTWLLPSPSGANAYYQADTLVRCLRELRSVI